MRVRDVGERGLIERLRTLLEELAPAGDSLRVGIGDDAAVLDFPTGSVLATSDLFMEGVHFRPDVDGEDLGYKVMAAGLSDIAAMGGRPLFALVSLALYGETPVSFVDRLYIGMGRLAAAHGVAVAGGDTTGSPGPLVIDVAILGVTVPGGPFLDSGAQAGDLVFVTGDFGASAAGLRLLSSADGPAGLSEEIITVAKRAHFRPPVRLREGMVLAALVAAEDRRPAARDASDGLAAALMILARSSGVGMEIRSDRVPVAACARTVGGALGLDPLQLALYGGEDYELVFTLPETAGATAVEAIRAETGTPVTPIGRVTAGQGVRLTSPNGGSRSLVEEGFRHF